MFRVTIVSKQYGEGFILEAAQKVTFYPEPEPDGAYAVVALGPHESYRLREPYFSIIVEEVEDVANGQRRKSFHQDSFL